MISNEDPQYTSGYNFWYDSLFSVEEERWKAKQVDLQKCSF